MRVNPAKMQRSRMTHWHVYNVPMRHPGYDSEDEMADKTEILLVGPPKPTIVNGLAAFTVHRLSEANDQNDLLTKIAPQVRAIAASVTSEKIDGDLMRRLPHLK